MGRIGLFKKEQDPFALLLEESENGGKSRERAGSNSMLRRSTTRSRPERVRDDDDASPEVSENQYHSPFRTEEEAQRAREIRKQKFAHISPEAAGSVDPSRLGYNVITDENVAKPRDILIPAGLKETEAQQLVTLTALEMKERQLQYWKDSQKIIDLTQPEDGEVVVVEDVAEDDGDDDAVDVEKEPSIEQVADAFEDTEAIVQDDEEEPIDLKREPKPEAALRAFEEAEAIVQDDEEEEPVDDVEAEPPAAVAVEALEEAEAIALGQTPPKVPLAEEEEAEHPNGVEKAETDDAKEYVDPSREPKPEAALRAFEEAEAIVQDDEEEPIDLKREPKPEAALRAFEEAEAIVQDDIEEPVDDVEAEPSPEEAARALEEAEVLATGDPQYLPPPPDIKSAPQVPFEVNDGTANADDKSQQRGGGGLKALGFLNIFKRSSKNTPEAAAIAAAAAAGAIVTREGAPVATPEDPEHIVKTTNGYLSKVVYDKLEYDELIHQAKLNKFSEEKTAKYNAKAQEYEDKIQSIQKEIADLEAQMEQCKLEHEEKMKLKQVVASQTLLDTNVKHINAKTALYRETEQIKLQTIADKEDTALCHEQVQKEIDDLLLMKEEVNKEHHEHENKVSALITDLDTKTAALNESLAKKEETNAQIQALEEEKAKLEQEIKAVQEEHQGNVANIESIDNKEYLPKVNEINTEISTLLGSLALIQQEIANQKVEFSTVTKKLEQERKEHEEQLLREKEERERLEKDRLNKQRAEYEAKAEEARLRHEEELAELKRSHEEANKKAILEKEEAHKKLLEEQAKRDQVERERTRLQGEKAIAEQEKGNPADKLLEREHVEKQKRQAEAAAAAEEKLKNAQKNPAMRTKDSSLYDYETVEEIITIPE